MDLSMEPCLICEGKCDIVLDSKYIDEEDCFQMFEHCFNLNFPKKSHGNYHSMCVECILRLRECFSFRAQCERAHRRLEYSLRNAGNGSVLRTVSESDSETEDDKSRIICELRFHDYCEIKEESSDDFADEDDTSETSEDDTPKITPDELMEMIERKLEFTSTVVSKVESKFNEKPTHPALALNSPHEDNGEKQASIMWDPIEEDYDTCLTINPVSTIPHKNSELLTKKDCQDVDEDSGWQQASITSNSAPDEQFHPLIKLTSSTPYQNSEIKNVKVCQDTGRQQDSIKCNPTPERHSSSMTYPISSIVTRSKRDSSWKSREVCQDIDSLSRDDTCNEKKNYKIVEEIQWVDCKFKPINTECLPEPLEMDALECPKCGDCFPNNSKTYLHYITHFPGFDCYECQETLYSKRGLNILPKCPNFTHQLKILERTCQLCNKVLKNKPTRDSHMKKMHDGIKCDKIVGRRCSYCSMLCANSESCLKHMRKKHQVPIKYARCVICRKIFMSMEKLNLHITYVHEKKHKLFCEICPQLFLTEHRFNNHQKNRHKDESDLPVCKLCGKKFTNMRGLKAHYRKSKHGPLNYQKEEKDNNEPMANENFQNFNI